MYALRELRDQTAETLLQACAPVFSVALRFRLNAVELNELPSDLWRFSNDDEN
jgi:predicted ATPase